MSYIIASLLLLGVACVAYDCCEIVNDRAISCDFAKFRVLMIKVKP